MGHVVRIGGAEVAPSVDIVLQGRMRMRMLVLEVRVVELRAVSGPERGKEALDLDRRIARLGVERAQCAAEVAVECGSVRERPQRGRGWSLGKQLPTKLLVCRSDRCSTT